MDCIADVDEKASCGVLAFPPIIRKILVNFWVILEPFTDLVQGKLVPLRHQDPVQLIDLEAKLLTLQEISAELSIDLVVFI